MSDYELSRIANEQYDRIAKLEARIAELENRLATPRPLHDEPENDLIDEPIPTGSIQTIKLSPVRDCEALLARNEKLEAALDDYLRLIGKVRALPTVPFTMAERLSEVQLRIVELKAARDG